jgi:hypothetical protein
VEKRCGHVVMLLAPVRKAFHCREDSAEHFCRRSAPFRRAEQLQAFNSKLFPMTIEGFGDPIRAK